MNIKKELERYNITLAEIENLENQIKNVSAEAMPSLTPNYSAMPSGKGTVSDITLNTVISIISNENRLESILEAKKAKVKYIDKLIKTLNHKAQVIIKKRTLEKKTFELIADELPDEKIEIYNADYVKKLYYQSLKTLQNLSDTLENAYSVKE